MQNSLKSSTVLLSIFGGALMLGHLAQAYEGESRGREDWQVRRHERQRQFALGVCVGQTLAQQGVTLPVQPMGQRPSLDSTTQAALQNAVQSCRSQMQGNGASPTPSPMPSSTPAPTETPSSTPTN